MEIVKMILPWVLIALGAVVVFLVLMQQGKAHGLSGAIAGGAETFFGKEKGKQMNAKVGKWTTWLAVAFVVIVFALYVTNPEVKHAQDFSADNWSLSPYAATATTEYVDI
jgi:preprotein translocase subunit SecG